jgi:hypothetical protein
LALELKRRELELRKAGLVSVITPSVSHSVDDDVDDDEDDDNHSNSSSDSESSEDKEEGITSKISGKSRRRNGKLTTAQRNKQRRLKRQSHEEIQAREEKRVTKDIARTELFIKAIENEYKKTEAKKQLKELHSIQHSTVDTTALHDDEVKAVPLSDELRGSLRRLTPRGGQITDRVEEMRRNGELSSRDRKRKHFEKPHGSRRVVWVPKYKI